MINSLIDRSVKTVAPAAASHTAFGLWGVEIDAELPAVEELRPQEVREKEGDRDEEGDAEGVLVGLKRHCSWRTCGL